MKVNPTELELILGKASRLADEMERKHLDTAEHNLELLKTLAVIKTNLERAVKQQPNNLATAVYDSIDLARKFTPYTNNGKIQYDPPLTDAEKTLNITVAS
jgi:hypothetical protein